MSGLDSLVRGRQIAAYENVDVGISNLSHDFGLSVKVADRLLRNMAYAIAVPMVLNRLTGFCCFGA